MRKIAKFVAVAVMMLFLVIGTTVVHAQGGMSQIFGNRYRSGGIGLSKHI